MTPPTSSGFGTTMRTSRKSYSRKTLTHVSPGSMISSSTSDSDNSLHSLYFTSYHGLINYPQKIPAQEARDLLETFIAEHFETPTQPPARAVYRAYHRACVARGLAGLSERTF